MSDRRVIALREPVLLFVVPFLTVLGLCVPVAFVAVAVDRRWGEGWAFALTLCGGIVTAAVMIVLVASECHPIRWARGLRFTWDDEAQQ